MNFFYNPIFMTHLLYYDKTVTGLRVLPVCNIGCRRLTFYWFLSCGKRVWAGKEIMDE